MEFPDTLIEGELCHLWTICRCPENPGIPWMDTVTEGVGGTIYRCLGHPLNTWMLDSIL